MTTPRVNPSHLSCASVPLAVLIACVTLPARAQSTDAEQLFREGKQRMTQQDYGHACPMFEQSFVADPATGTLLALALCHERQGKFASAAREYAEAATRSERENRPDRAQAARSKLATLEPRLSKLTIDGTKVAALSELQVSLNGRPMERAALSVATPVDGGEYLIEASAVGGRTWRERVTIVDGGESKTVQIPDLGALAPSVAHAAAEPAAPPQPLQETPASVQPAAAKLVPLARRAPTSARAGLSTMQGVGTALLVAGALGLGTGTYFSFRAIAKNSQSAAGCDGDLCSPAGRETRLSARAAGNAATVAFLVGGGLATAGFISLLVGKRSSNEAARDTSLALWAAPRSAGAVWQGRW